MYNTLPFVQPLCELGYCELLDSEQPGFSELFHMTILPIYYIKLLLESEQLDNSEQFWAYQKVH